MLDWQTFEDNIVAAMEEGFDSSSDFANTLVDEYILLVESGSQTLTDSSITSYNDAPLRAGFTAMFEFSLNSNVPLLSLPFIHAPLMLFWTGATLSPPSTPPPGFSVVTTVTITVPGIVALPLIPPPPVPSVSPFVSALRLFFTPHFLTLQGTYVGLGIPVPPAPPPPLTIPFVGYS